MVDETISTFMLPIILGAVAKSSQATSDNTM